MTASDHELVQLRTKPPRWLHWTLGSCCVGLVLLVWWFVTLGAASEDRIVPATILPSPAEVFGSLHSLLTERQLFRSVTATLQRVLLGFGLAAFVSVPLGILAGSWRGIESFTAPLSLFGRNIPIAALVPLTIVWFGTGENQKVMFIFLATAPFIFGSTVQAILEVHVHYVETARTLGASRWQTVTKVLVPLALPGVYNSLRILFGLAFGYIMLAEVIDAKHGLGHLITTSQRRGLNEHIYLILILIGLIAYGIDRLLWWFQRGLFPFRTEGKET